MKAAIQGANLTLSQERNIRGLLEQETRRVFVEGKSNPEERIQYWLDRQLSPEAQSFVSDLELGAEADREVLRRQFGSRLERARSVPSLRFAADRVWADAMSRVSVDGLGMVGHRLYDWFAGMERQISRDVAAKERESVDLEKSLARSKDVAREYLRDHR
jgi:hypothetical protein